MDYLGSLPLINQYVLVVIYQRSRYPGIESINSTSAISVTMLLSERVQKSIQNHIGNGPPFQSKVANLMKSKGIKHNRITPLWLQVNGLVERFMRLLMKVIRAARIGENMQEFCFNFLASYRATPYPTTNIAASEMMFGTPTKYVLPHLDVKLETATDDVTETYCQKKVQSKEYIDKERAKDRTIQAGGQVLVRKCKTNKVAQNFDVTAKTINNHVITQ